MNQRKPNFSRLHVLIALLLGVLIFYLGELVNIQVIHHQEYLQQSTHSITRMETVSASRGIITDRNGQPLVSNRSVYSLTFDPSLLQNGERENDALLRLLQLCEQQKLEWADHLPVSAQPPFTFTVDSLSDTQKVRFFSYLKSLKSCRSLLESYLGRHSAEDGEPAPEDDADPLDVIKGSWLTNQMLANIGLSAEDLFEIMREDLDIPAEYSRQDARLVMGVQYELALRSLGTNAAYVLADEVDTDFISILADGNYSGAKISSSFSRTYETACAAHVLGSVGRISDISETENLPGTYKLDDWIGKSGAELAFEPYLKSTDGKRIVATNSDGKITDEYYSIEPKPGSTVELTLDLHLQAAVEDALAEAVESLTAKDGITSRGAGAAVIKVGTGEVLALASYPTYDPSTYRQTISELLNDEAKPLTNRATFGTYPPGSTLKPATAVAALESGATTVSEQLYDSGYWKYPSTTWNGGTNCWNHAGHGWLSVTGAITNSCNYYFAEMGYRMGLDQLNSYYTAFGLGQHTGIEIGDASGRLASNEDGGDQAPWAAYGQANQLYTPLQLANYIATLVSGGKHCEAHLLKSVKSYDNSEIIAVGNTDPVNTIPISDSTLQAVKQGMLGYTTGSLSSYFKDCVVSAGAKTGTAQINKTVKNNGVFVCFAPYDEPEIAVALVLEQGDAGAALSSTAVSILNSYFGASEIGIAVISENQLLP